MKKSSSILLSSLVALGILSTSAMADGGKIKKGQKGYLKTCKKCHGNGTKGAAMKSQKEWAALFANDGAEIIKLHEGDKKAKKFFGSKKFRKYAPHLKAFLWQYGNDSGNVPTCG